jgi:probable rRNA maturation factor
MSAPSLLHLSVQQATRRACPDRSQVRRWIQAALAAAKIGKPAEFVVRFCDSPEARRLNQEFRGRDYATNVLTFTHGDTHRIGADIVLCVPVLEREARSQHKPMKYHTAHLVVHGALHALGYDHETKRGTASMEALEISILARFRVPDPYGD